MKYIERGKNVSILGNNSKHRVCGSTIGSGYSNGTTTILTEWNYTK